MIHPVKKVYITQKFGANPASYARFNYKGHNGLDYRAFLPDGSRCYEVGKSEIFAPHEGKIIERAFDQDGYGWYIKIENNLEGSILAHMDKPSPLAVGAYVKEGDFVGYQGLTGNTTGIHLHWGFYLIPRNKANGYGGMIDQESLIGGNNMTDSAEVIKLKEDLAQANRDKTSLTNQVAGWVRDSQNGTWVAKVDVEKREKISYDKGFEAGKASVQSEPLTVELDNWEVNGLTISTVEGNKTISLNYKQK